MYLRVPVIQRILGILLALFSLSFLPPLLIGLHGNNSDSSLAFGGAFLLLLTTGLILWLPVRHIHQDLHLRDGFIIVVLFWVALGMAGSLPLIIADSPDLSVSDAIFESVSALTTTGATIITQLDSLPKPILFYRQELQWLGGMGIIVLAVAILPMLGIGGIQLYRAETPGPVKDTKLTPRITETAKTLWYIYLGMTIACMIAYRFAGMSWFDAICHSFSTISIGGFSTHDASLGFFDSSLIESIAIVFMFLAGINFSLHFFAWRKLSVRSYWEDAEFRAYCLLLASVCILCIAYQWLISEEASLLKITEDSVFQTVSIATTTGFTTTSYGSWPGFLPVLLLFSSFIGACAGSTGGGLKVIRILLLFKQGTREIKRLVHPNGVFTIKIGRRLLPERIIEAIWGYFATFAAIFTLLMLAIMATGLDQVTAFSAIAACINNLGPGLGEVSQHYANINDAAKWILCLAMLLGRLEIFTLLVILTPTFWRG